jgi:hypothetical protein
VRGCPSDKHRHGEAHETPNRRLTQ